MPIYEYECEKCGEVFEVFRRISDPAPESHSCGSRKVRRVMSQTSFVLKGDGWYITDYARKGKKGKEDAREKTDTGSTKKESGTDKKKSDSKAA